MSRLARLTTLTMSALLLIVTLPGFADAQRRAVPRHPSHPPRPVVVRGHVFIGGYFYDPVLWTVSVVVTKIDLPGMKKEDVKVEVTDGQLAISGERKTEAEEKKENFYRCEREYGTFYRTVRASRLKVWAVATRKRATCAPEDDVQGALATTRQARVRRLSVVGFGGTVLGNVSMNDILLAAGAGQGVDSEDVVQTLQTICAHHSIDAGIRAMKLGPRPSTKITNPCNV